MTVHSFSTQLGAEQFW